MGEKAGGGGGDRKRRLRVQSTCLPQAEGSVCRAPAIRGWTESPRSLQPALTQSFSILRSLQRSKALVAPPQASRGVEGIPSHHGEQRGGEQLGGRGAGDWHTVSSGGRVGKSPSTPLPCRMGLHIDPRPQAGPSGASSAPASGKAPGLRS